MRTKELGIYQNPIAAIWASDLLWLGLGVHTFLNRNSNFAINRNCNQLLRFLLLLMLLCTLVLVFWWKMLQLDWNNCLELMVVVGMGCSCPAQHVSTKQWTNVSIIMTNQSLSLNTKKLLFVIAWSGKSRTCSCWSEIETEWRAIKTHFWQEVKENVWSQPAKQCSNANQWFWKSILWFENKMSWTIALLWLSARGAPQLHLENWNKMNEHKDKMCTLRCSN